MQVECSKLMLFNKNNVIWATVLSDFKKTAILINTMQVVREVEWFVFY